jgi:hypothetical protein
MDDAFNAINTPNFYYIKKSIRKILKDVKKFIRYSQNKETEAALLLYFCKLLKAFKPSISKNTQLQNMYQRQLLLAEKAIAKLHEDLQYDYKLLVEELNETF